MRRAGIVFLGGGIGSALRALLVAYWASWGHVLPLPILLINTLGTCSLAIVSVLATGQKIGPEMRLFLAVGILGGFTTFSTLVWGANTLFAQGVKGGEKALLLLSASLLSGIVAANPGFFIGRKILSLITGETAPSVRRRHAPEKDVSAADIAAIEVEDRDA